MITKSQSFTTSDNTIHATIEAARQHELSFFIGNQKEPFQNSTEMAAFLIIHAEKVMDLLSTKAGSRPAARKVNKPKTPKQKPEKPTQHPLEPAQPSLKV